MRLDVRGNTLAIVAASLVPLTAMIGSGIDMSRAYLAQNRLQHACDAGALAGRRVMTANALDAGVIAETTKFFNFNFRQNQLETASFTPTITMPTTGTVRVQASTTMKTDIMKIFGFRTLPIKADCNASQNFVNTDIVLVLDTTGSMACDVNGNNCNSGSTSKIVALRAAVLAFYDQLKVTQDQLTAAGLRLRYAIVPYSTTVNVGQIVRGVNPSYIVSDNTYKYWTRVPQYTTTTSSNYVQTNQTSSAQQISQSGVQQSDCTVANANAAYGSHNDSYSNNNNTKTSTDVTFSNVTWTSPSTCKGTQTTTTTTYQKQNTPTQTFNGNYVYGQYAVDLSSYSTFAAVQTPSEGNPDTSTWAGCIEERQTAVIAPGASYTIPAAAFDLDINKIPDNTNATKWAPQWPDIEYYPNGSSNGTSLQSTAFCPSPAKRLSVWNRTDLNTYLNGLTASGNTYHDAGMRWGARLLSPLGIFGADNPSVYNGMPVNRFVIFMTDGTIQTSTTSYAAYGVEALDKRVGGGVTNDLDARHDQRFRMLCQAAKSMKDENGNSARVSVWVIGFAQALTSSLSECASNSNQASTVANQPALIAKFAEIGKSIGALRLTQ